MNKSFCHACHQEIHVLGAVRREDEHEEDLVRVRMTVRYEVVARALNPSVKVTEQDTEYDVAYLNGLFLSRVHDMVRSGEVTPIFVCPHCGVELSGREVADCIEKETINARMRALEEESK